MDQSFLASHLTINIFRGRETKAPGVTKGKEDQNPRARDRSRVVAKRETECYIVDECYTIEEEKVLRINNDGNGVFDSLLHYTEQEE